MNENAREGTSGFYRAQVATAVSHLTFVKAAALDACFRLAVACELRRFFSVLLICQDGYEELLASELKAGGVPGCEEGGGWVLAEKEARTLPHDWRKCQPRQ